MNILGTWKLSKKVPFGEILFSRYLGYRIPYSGSIGARITEIGPGYCRIALRDRRSVRNHLNSVHAAALMNLAEFASGLALTTALPPDARAILVQYSIEFIKKARGPLVAESRCNRITSTEPRELPISAEIKDSKNEIVARVTAVWKVGQKQ